MARYTQSLRTTDFLGRALHASLSDEFLLAPCYPSDKHALVASPALGICIVSMEDGQFAPEASDTGGVTGIDHTSIIRQVKERLGAAFRTVPIAWLAWYPMVLSEVPVSPDIQAIHVMHGTDIEQVQNQVSDALLDGSIALSEKVFLAMEERLREGPTSLPRAPSPPPPAPAPIPKRVVVGEGGKPMSQSDPMFLLMSHSIRNVVGENPIEAFGASLSIPDLTNPSNLLPAILVVAAEEWAAADLSTKGRGGFHIYLTTVSEEGKSWTGFAVTDIAASSALVLNLSITSLLRNCRSSNDIFLLDNLLARYSRFMETNGYSSMEMKRLAMSVNSREE